MKTFAAVALGDHVLLREHYQEGVAAGRAYAAGEGQALPNERSLGERETLLWQLLVRSPLRDEADALAEMREIRALLPEFAERAFAEGFNDGLRLAIAEEVARRFRPPARWLGVLRQSDRRELAGMLAALRTARTWTGFFAAAVR